MYYQWCNSNTVYDHCGDTHRYIHFSFDHSRLLGQRFNVGFVLLDIYILVQSHCFSVLLSISVLCFGIKHTKDFHVNSATQLHVKNTSGLIHTPRLVFLMPYVTITCKTKWETNLSLTKMISVILGHLTHVHVQIQLQTHTVYKGTLYTSSFKLPPSHSVIL